MGQSKAQKEYNRTMKENAAQDRALQREMFEHSKKDSPEMARFRIGAANWDKFVAGKDYSKPPSTSLLNFDLMTPARQNNMRQKMANVTGIGAAAMSGSGDQSIALAQTREHNANLAAQEHGAAYENAIKQEDAYYKGQGMGWAQLDSQRNISLLSNATQSAQFMYDQQRQTLPPSFMQTWGPLFGAALGAGASILSGGFAAGGTFAPKPTGAPPR
jgi:hypothetical protein